MLSLAMRPCRCPSSWKMGNEDLSWSSPPPSGHQQLNVLQHFIKCLAGGRVCILEGHLDPAVEAEGLQLQPDEAKAVVIKQDKNPGRLLRTGEAMASDESRPIEAGEQRRKTQGTVSGLACGNTSQRRQPPRAVPGTSPPGVSPTLGLCCAGLTIPPSFQSSRAPLLRCTRSFCSGRALCQMLRPKASPQVVDAAPPSRDSALL